MIGDGRCGYTGIIYSRQLQIHDRVALAVGFTLMCFKKTFIIDHKGVTGLMQGSLQILPANEVDRVGYVSCQFRLCSQYGETALMEISSIIYKSTCVTDIFCIFTKAVACFYRGTDTPLCCQMQDIVIVLVLCIIKRAFITKILCNSIAEVPGLVIRINPAYQAVSRTSGCHHIGIIDGCTVGRPEIAALVFIHRGVIRAKIQLNIISNRHPDCIYTQRPGRHSCGRPVNGIIGIMIIRSI